MFIIMRIVLILQNIPDEIMVLVKSRKIIMASALYPDQGYFVWVDLL